MAGAYNKATEKLIECDFGCGDDLMGQDLQVAFHRDIVTPLEHLEEQLRKLKLDV